MRLLASAAAAIAALAGTAEARAQQRYALALFHFNLQYVAGGMVGFSFLPDERSDLDESQVADLIVTESLVPVLDLYERHPSWGADIAVQGQMLDFLAARHPDTLDQLRRMAKGGQIDVVSFTYGHGFLLGYPAEDWERSQALAAAAFERHDVPLSRTAWCQEGQAGLGLAARMTERGYRTLVWPKNLWIHQHGAFEPEPLYAAGDGWIVVGGLGVEHQGPDPIEVTWTFLDDGELLATGGLNPYTIDEFDHDPAAVAEYEARLVALEEQGWMITSVDRYVEAVKDRVTPATPPPLFDGTWQPGSTDGVFRWFGGSGLWYDQERDNVVRPLLAIAHRELVAAETASEVAGLDARERLDAAWRLLALGEISDATGINPFRGEVEYGIGHAAEALRVARDVIVDSKTALALESVEVDPQAGSVTPAGPDPLRGEPVDPALELELEGQARAPSESWEQIGPGHFRVAVRFPATEEYGARAGSVRFPGELAPLVTTRALEDELAVSYDRGDFTIEGGELLLALPIGLVSLGESRFVIKDQALAHLAARIFDDSGDVLFEDRTIPPEEAATWVFHVFEGSNTDAIALAIDVNSKRRLVR